MIIIGFGYKKRVGKDTACKFLMSELRQKGVDIQRCSFADEIKTISYHKYKWGGLQDRLYYEDNEAKIEEILPPIGKTPRQIWDHEGFSAHEFCEKTWCELTFAKMEGDVIIIPSVRRLVEIDYIKKYTGGKVIRIDRDVAPKSEHPVDHMLDSFTGWDEVIQNNGDLKDFYQTIKKLIPKLGVA